MMGKTHALSGLVAGVAAGEVLHQSLAGAAVLAGLSPGFALIGDLDHACGTATHCLGFVSQAFAWVVEKLSGGHRRGTHSAFGVAVFTAAAWAACHWRDTVPGRAGLAFTILLAVAAGLRGLGLQSHWADLAAAGAAAAVTFTGWGLALVPVACAVGCTAHLLGDALTDEGIPIAWPLSRRHVRLLPEPFAFTTGTRPERWVVAPALAITLGFLAVYAATTIYPI